MLHIILHVQRSLTASTYKYSINQCYTYVTQKSDITKAEENWRQEWGREGKKRWKTGNKVEAEVISAIFTCNVRLLTSLKGLSEITTVLNCTNKINP